MVELGITESYSVKRQVVTQASEAAEMILREEYTNCIDILYLFQIKQLLFFKLSKFNFFVFLIHTKK